MTLPLLGVLLAALVLGATIVSLVRAMTGHRFEPDPAVVADFAIERYQPMFRLLENDDIEFLRRQPGFDERIGKRLTRKRAEVLSLYLDQLTNDFRHLHGMARLLVAHGEDRPDLSWALFRQSITFWWTIGVLRCQLKVFGYVRMPVTNLSEGRLNKAVAAAAWMRQLAVGPTLAG